MVFNSFLVACSLMAGCATEKEDPTYDPHRTLVETVAVLQHGLSADIYRFEPPRDLTGENLYRASLARLGRYRDLLDHPGFENSILFAEAQARERLFDFEGASLLYAEVSASSSPLVLKATEAFPFSREMADVLQADITASQRPDEVMLDLAGKRVRLRQLLGDLEENDVRRNLVLVSIERLDVREREFLWRIRALSQQGTQVALEAARQLIADHDESFRVLDHTLRLGDMYAEIARGYVASVDPSNIDFDAAYARNLIQAAAHVYAEVAAVDGRPEREEARARLAGLEAFVQRIGGT